LETSAPAPRVDAYTTDRPGADFMVDVLKSLNFDYICANPGSSFRGLQESFINYGGNKDPKWITWCHEESSVASRAIGLPNRPDVVLLDVFIRRHNGHAGMPRLGD
jgi:hypothetical protein